MPCLRAALLLLLLGSPPSSLHHSCFIGLSPMIPFMLWMHYLTPPDTNTNGEGLKKITRGKLSVATSCTGRHFSLLVLLLSILFAQQQRRLIMICFLTDRKDPEVWLTWSYTDDYYLKEAEVKSWALHLRHPHMCEGSYHVKMEHRTCGPEYAWYAQTKHDICCLGASSVRI